MVLAHVVSLTGSHVTGLAVPTLAILTLDAGPFAAALLFALGHCVRGLIGPLLGVLVDRASSPRAVLVGADLAHAVVVATVPLAYLLGAVSMPLLFAVAAAGGVLGGVSELSVQASLPWLVPRERLVSANSALAGARAAGTVTGPGLAGLLVQALGAATAMVADAVSYLLSAVLLRRLRVTRSAAPSSRGLSLLAAFLEGGRVLRGRPVLIRLALAGAALNLGGAGIGALYVLYAYRTLGLGPLVVGLTVAVYSASSIAAVLTVRRLVDRLGMARTVSTFAPVAALALALIPAASLGHPIPLLVVYEAVFGYCGTVWLVAATTLQQTLVPADALARVTALTRSVGTLAIPAGALAGGAAAELAGPTPVLAALALVALLGTLTVLRRPRHPHPPPP